MYALDAFVSSHPEAFVGLVPRDGVATIVLASGTDAAVWAARIRAAAGSLTWAATRCPSPDPGGDCGGLFPRTEGRDEQVAAGQAKFAETATRP